MQEERYADFGINSTTFEFFMTCCLSFSLSELEIFVFFTIRKGSSLWTLLSFRRFFFHTTVLFDAYAKNMVTFPEEPRPLAVKRTISHRRWLNGEKTDFTKF